MSETNETQPLSILITSGKSGVGKSLARHLLSAGYKVAITPKSTEDAAVIRNEVKAIPIYFDPQRPGEIQGLLKMTGAQVVINLAPMTANELPFYPDANYSGDLLRNSTTALVEAAKAAGVEFIVHTSYAFLYGDAHGQPVDEQSRLNASDHPLFDAAKQAEKIVMNSGILACVLRAGYIYGAETPALHHLETRIKAGRPIVAGKNNAGWVHADDLADAILLAVQKRPAGEVFNIVDDTPVTTVEFMRDFAQALGIKEPAPAAGPLSRLFGDRNVQALLKQSSKPSNAKAKEKLGWSPRFPQHTAGFEDILLTWRAQSAVTAAE